LAGLLLPVAAWVLRREAFWIGLPVAGVLAGAGASAVLYVRQSKPLKVVAAGTLMMTFILLCAVIWIFPYIETFKSRRFFSMEVKRIVPATAILYIYADTMNDFNYYTEREAIPVLQSPDEVGKLLAAGKDDYLLIKERDLQRIASIPREMLVATDAVGSTRWYLVSLGNAPSKR